MSLKHIINLYELLDDYNANGNQIKEYLIDINPQAIIDVTTVQGDYGSTDFIKITIPGNQGKKSGHLSPTLGIIGRLGGLGARPEVKGFVSDGDGALSALAIAAKFLSMQSKGDTLQGDVIISTHICPTAPTQPHHPVPFMGSPVDMAVMNQYEVDTQMDAILSVDTTKGNHIVNHKGFAITPTVKEGYILKFSNDLLNIYSQVAGILPITLPITTQDITPYANQLHHINSIMQPCVSTSAPVVGVAITTESAVAGSASGASHLDDIDKVVRYCIEVAKQFCQENCTFFDNKEFERIIKLYGRMSHLQTLGTLEEENDK